MRSLSLHDTTIQIASVAGESRRVNVSGLAKARLLWLFRNFSILEFPVLSRAQQQLILRMWDSGMRVPAKKGTPQNVIGIVEAFSPQLCSKETDSSETDSLTPTKLHRASGKQSLEQLYSHKGGRPRARFTLRDGLRSAATWRAFSILLVGAAMYLGPRYLPPKHPPTPQTQVAAAADEKQQTRSEPFASAPSRPPAKPSAIGSAERVSTEPVVPGASVPVVPTAPAPVVATELSPVATPMTPPEDANVIPSAPAAAAPDLPQAMAHDVSPQQVAPPKRSVSGAGPQEVLIRVSVSAAGQPQSFHVLRGEEETVPEALKAARLWNFKPCSGGEACQQVLKFTNYGDSSRVQRIE